MTLFLQQVIGGLTIGGMYALLALALVFSFRSTGVVNFAQGEMAMFSTYLAWQMHTWDVPFYLAVLVSIAASFVIGGAVYAVLRFGYRDLHDEILGLFRRNHENPGAAESRTS